MRGREMTEETKDKSGPEKERCPSLSSILKSLGSSRYLFSYAKIDEYMDR